jgi:hypothetical protein
MLGKRLLLGRKRTTQASWRGATRLCPVCGDMKPVREFIPRGRARGLNLYCNNCRLHDKEGVKRLFRVGRPTLRANRREAIRYLRALAHRRLAKKEGSFLMRPEKYAMKVAKLPERIAAVVGKTYAVMGDAFEVADDEALMRIRDYLEEIDPSLIERNKNKRLGRR